MSCKICGGTLYSLGSKHGKLLSRDFVFDRCENCSFVSVRNPCTDYARLYDDGYYQGKGVDPLVDYEFELDHPSQTVRQYEWRGICDALSERFRNASGLSWLDFGCGSGGLVRYAKEKRFDCVGFDTGSFTEKAKAKGIPILNSLDASIASFDVITMIEVIEHVTEPMETLKVVRNLLKPKGVLFLTTGVAPKSDTAFLQWGYVIPEIHVSYFNPSNMHLAMHRAGLKPTPGSWKGWDDIIRFKVLKNLGIKQPNILERLVPWSVASRIVDWMHHSSSYPVGIKE